MKPGQNGIINTKRVFLGRNFSHDVHRHKREMGDRAAFILSYFILHTRRERGFKKAITLWDQRLNGLIREEGADFFAVSLPLRKANHALWTHNDPRRREGRTKDQNGSVGLGITRSGRLADFFEGRNRNLSADGLSNKSSVRTYFRFRK